MQPRCRARCGEITRARSGMIACVTSVSSSVRAAAPRDRAARCAPNRRSRRPTRVRCLRTARGRSEPVRRNRRSGVDRATRLPSAGRCAIAATGPGRRPRPALGDRAPSPTSRADVRGAPSDDDRRARARARTARPPLQACRRSTGTRRARSPAPRDRRPTTATRAPASARHAPRRVVVVAVLPEAFEVRARDHELRGIREVRRGGGATGGFDRAACTLRCYRAVLRVIERRGAPPRQ